MHENFTSEKTLNLNSRSVMITWLGFHDAAESVTVSADVRFWTRNQPITSILTFVLKTELFDSRNKIQLHPQIYFDFIDPCKVVLQGN